MALCVRGAFGRGTVFKLTSEGVLTTLHDFDYGTEGCDPFAALIQASDGNLYGTTVVGGMFGGGTVFNVTPAGVLTTLHAFDCVTEGATPPPPSSWPATAASMARCPPAARRAVGWCSDSSPIR